MTPMFHANGAWGFTHAAPMVGAKLVLPGPKMDGASIANLIEAEGVTVAAGVPTLYSKLLQHLETQGQGAGALKRIVIAGSAPAPSMIEGFERLGRLGEARLGHDRNQPLRDLSAAVAKYREAAAAAPASPQGLPGQPIYVST